MTPELLDWLKERMDRIEDKLDAVNDHCNSIDRTLTKNTEDIKHHILRTDSLQELVEKFKAHLARLHGIGWFIGFVGTVAGVVKYFGLV